MPSAQTYSIDVAFHGRDRGAQAMADGLGGSLSGLQGHLDRVAAGMERLGMFGAVAIGAVAAVGVRALARDVVSLNSATQNTTIGIAGMLTANGGAATFANGMEQAGAALAQIRRDANALPGEAQDFVNVFHAALPAALQAGMRSALDVSQFTNQFGAVAIAFNVDSGQAGRDLRQLLQGHAGADVAMWNNLQANVGKTAAQFNKLAAPERLAALQRATGQYSEMVGAFGGTFGTAISTLVSNAHRLEELATKPLFDRATARLQEMGAYLTLHGPQIEETVTRWGEQGARAFDVIYERGGRAIAYLREHWRELLGEAQAGARDIVTVYAALRAGSGAISAVQGGAQLVGALRGASGAAAGVGGASAAGAVGAVGAGMLGLVGAMALADRNGVVNIQRELATLAPVTERASASLLMLWRSTEPLVAAVGGVLVHVFVGLAQVVLEAVNVFASIVSIVPTVYNFLRNFTHDAIFGQSSLRGSAATSASFAAQMDSEREATRAHLDPVLRSVVVAVTERPAARTTPHPAAPRHNTTIHNHFKIEQADNPERVALSVMHVMRRELRNPTQSARPGVTSLR